MPRQTGQTFVFGSEPKALAQPHHILDLVLSWTWVSRPMTASYSIVRGKFNHRRTLLATPKSPEMKGAGLFRGWKAYFAAALAGSLKSHSPVCEPASMIKREFTCGCNGSARLPPTAGRMPPAHKP